MTERIPDFPVDPLFVNRWSPRAYAGEEMPEADLLTVLEAARWAPSSYNYQPWRFLYARRGDGHWPQFLDLLTPFNIVWAQNAAALIFVLSDRLMQRDASGGLAPSRTHSFDAGAAWAQLGLQATRLGYHARGMAGVDLARARVTLGVPERYDIQIAIAVGRRASPTILPDELQEQEAPSPRRPIRDIAFAGTFPTGPAWEREGGADVPHPAASA